METAQQVIAADVAPKQMLRLAAEAEPGLSRSRGRRDGMSVLVADPALAAAADQVVRAARAASALPVHTLSMHGDADDRSGTVMSRLWFGTGPRSHSIARALVLAPAEHAARRLVSYTRSLGAAPSDIDVAILARTNHPPPPDRGRPRVFPAARSRPGRLEDRDAAWLGRHLACAKLGIALGAGGAWGFAHLGALEVLRDAGYTVDAVAGTSIGALIGGLVAAQLPLERIASTVSEMFEPRTAGDLFGVSLSGISSGRERMVELLQVIFGERTLETLPVPLAVAVIDLDARRAEALTAGSLWQAVAASTALPGLYPPWEGDGRRLVDALALNPVPTGYLPPLTADVTLAIDLIGGSAVPAGSARSAGGSTARLFGALTEVLHVVAVEASHRHAAEADVVVRPSLPVSHWRDVALAEQYLAAGRAATEQQLPALRRIIQPRNQLGGIDV